MEFETTNDLQFFNNISDSIIIIDSNEKIIYANEYALEFIGINDFRMIENIAVNSIITGSVSSFKEAALKMDKVDKNIQKVRAVINTAISRVEVDVMPKVIKINKKPGMLLLLKNILLENNYFRVLTENKKEIKPSDDNLQYTILPDNMSAGDSNKSIKIYKAMLEASVTGVVIEKEGKIEYVNKAAKEFIAVDEDEDLRGKNLFDIIDIEQFNLSGNTLNSDYSDYYYKKNIIERKMIRRDGKIIYCEISPMCYIDKNIIYSIFLLRDVTRRVNGEQALLTNRNNYVMLLKTLPVGVVLYTDNKFEIANETHQRIFGIDDVSSMEDKKIWNYVDNDYKEIVKEMYYDAFFKDKFTDFTEVKVVRSDGKIVDIEMAAMGLNISNGRSVVVLCQEITERKRAQLNQLKLEQAIKYDKLKTEFISNMSHEFKTPLNIILSTVQVLQYNYRDSNDQQLNKYLNITKVNSYRLLRLINNLIDVTRIDVGNLKMNFGNYDIVKIVEDITMAAVEYVESKGMSLVFDTDVEEKIIGVDKTNIERIILNLLSNAVKFSKENGKIVVEVHDLEDRVQIQVKDNGIGIPEDMQDKIFDKFVQSEDLFTRSHEGSGIGLALVKSIVENHGGRIFVKSVVDGGSQFTVELPNILSKNNNVVDKTAYTSESENAEKIKIEFSDIYK